MELPIPSYKHLDIKKYNQGLQQDPCLSPILSTCNQVHRQTAYNYPSNQAYNNGYQGRWLSVSQQTAACLGANLFCTPMLAGLCQGKSVCNNHVICLITSGWTHRLMCGNDGIALLLHCCDINIRNDWGLYYTNKSMLKSMRLKIRVYII